MFNWPETESGEVPGPELVAALAMLGTVPAELIPMWAAHWLVAGYDGAALRMLAALGPGEIGEIHDVLPAALADCGAAAPDSRSVGAETAFATIAAMFLDGQITAPWLLARVGDVLASADYAEEVMGLPLGELYGVDDEWIVGWGRPHEEITVEIRAACQRSVGPSGLPPAGHRRSAGSCGPAAG